MRMFAPVLVIATLALPAIAIAQQPTSAPQPTPTTQPQITPPRFGEFLRQIDDLSAPQGVAISPMREIYVVERNAHRVSVFDRDGRWLRVLGATPTVTLSSTPASQPADLRSYGSEPGQFDRPTGVAVAPDGTVFVCDTGNHRVQVFDPAGEWRSTIGQRGAGPEDLYHPTAIAATAERVYVADTGNYRVQVFDHSGQRLNTLGAFGGRRPGDFLRPSGLAIDGEGRVYAADADAHRIQRFDALGTPLGPIGDRGYFPGLLAEPMGLAIRDQLLYVADSMNHRMQVFDLDGKRQYEWGLHVVKPRDGAGKLHYPNSIAIDPQGEFAVIGESLEDRVQIFGIRPPEDPLITDWNRPDPEPGSHFGERLCISGDLLFLSEPETCEIQVYDQAGPKPLQISTFGGYGSTPGRFIQPAGMHFDLAQRRLYVCDPGNQRVQLFRVRPIPQPLKFDPRLVSLEASFDLSAAARTETGLPVDPVALAPLPGGELLVLDRRNGRLLHLGAMGALLDTVEQWDPPLADAVDLATHLDWWTWVYVSDAGARRVRVAALDREKRWRQIPGAPLTTTDFLEPFGVACAPDGRVYVTDSVAHSVAGYFGKGGALTHQWSGEGLGPGQFHNPRGVATDAAGVVTMIDHGNHRAQTFTADGLFLRVFGARWYSKPAEISPTTRPTWPPPAWAEQRTRATKPKTGTSPRAAPPPASSAAAAAKELHAKSALGAFDVIAKLDEQPPPLNRPFELTLIVRDAKSSAPVSTETNVTVDADMPEHRHGLLSAPQLAQGGPGRFRVKELNFHMPGYWELYVDLTRDGVLERVIFPLEVE